MAAERRSKKAAEADDPGLTERPLAGRQRPDLLVQAVCDAAPVGIVVLELPSCAVQYWNDLGRAALGPGGASAFDLPALMHAGDWPWRREDGSRVPIRQLPWSRAAGGEVVRGERLLFEPVVGPSRVLRVSARPGGPARGAGVRIVLTLAETGDVARGRTLQAERDSLRELVLRLHEAREEERAILARRVHDDLGQVLVALQLELDHVAKALAADATGKAATRVHEMKRILRRLVRRVRRIARALRPPDLGDLVGALGVATSDFRRRTGVSCTLTVDGPSDDVPVGLRPAIHAIVREALTNVIRHARDTSSVLVHLEVSESGLDVSVRDHGVGIDDEALSSPKSIGLIGMRERAAQLGGKLTVERPEGGGTRVVAHLPF